MTSSPMALIDGFLRKKAKDPGKVNGVSKATVILYRRVFFGSADGKLVLADLLNDLEFLNMDVQKAEEVTRQNIARQILAKLGIWQPKNVYRLVEDFVGMPWDTEGENDGKDRP